MKKKKKRPNRRIKQTNIWEMQKGRGRKLEMYKNEKGWKEKKNED